MASVIVRLALIGCAALTLEACSLLANESTLLNTWARLAVWCSPQVEVGQVSGAVQGY